MVNLNTQENTEPVQPEPTPKNKLVAALLSLCLVGGAGHVYLGQSQKGWLLISISAMLSCTGLDFIVLIFGAIDAYYTAKKMERGQPVGKMEWFWQKTVTPAASEKGQDADTSGSDGQNEGGDKPAAETGDTVGGEDEPAVRGPGDSSGENGPGRVLITAPPIIGPQPAANGGSAPFVILSSQSAVDETQRDGDKSPTVAEHPDDIFDEKGGGGSSVI